MEEYPLKQVLEVKRDRVEKAEKVVKEKKRALEIEQEKLKKIEAERDAVLRHHNEKLDQLRAALDEGTTSDEVLMMKTYLKIVKEKLVKEEEKVKQQKAQVATAQKNLEEAQATLKRKRVEEEKIKVHKEEWEKQVKRETRVAEEKVQDELGATIHGTQKRKRL